MLFHNRPLTVQQSSLSTSLILADMREQDVSAGIIFDLTDNERDVLGFGMSNERLEFHSAFFIGLKIMIRILRICGLTIVCDQVDDGCHTSTDIHLVLGRNQFSSQFLLYQETTFENSSLTAIRELTANSSPEIALASTRCAAAGYTYSRCGFTAPDGVG